MTFNQPRHNPYTTPSRPWARRAACSCGWIDEFDRDEEGALVRARIHADSLNRVEMR